MATNGNFIAEIIDTCINGRPAPKARPDGVRVRLSSELLRMLNDGKTLRFVACGQEIVVVPPVRRRNHERT